MKVVVLTGPESTGKSWLSQVLVERFAAVRVEEYVRQFIEQQGRDTCYDDITAIARGQMALEDTARATAPPLLVLDTHLLSNILWSQTLFGDCPAWIEPALLSRHYDLHLLLSPEEVEWTGDGQRCQPDIEQRRVFFKACEAWLRRHRQVFDVVGGDWAQRQTQVLARVQALLSEKT